MKICFINDTFLIGRGVDTVIYELARRLCKKHDVTVICGKGLSNYKPKNFSIKEVSIEKLFTGNVKDFSYPLKLLRLRKEISKIDCDITNLHHSTLFPALLGKRNVIVTYHGSPPAYGWSKYPRTLVNFLTRFTLRFSRKIITISDYLKNELIKFGVPKEKIIVIPNGVSKEFKPTWEDNDYMLYVGRLEKHKRVEQLIRLAKRIRFPLVIVGEGPERRKLEFAAKELEAPVRFMGRVGRKKLIRLYQKCSFFVSASKWEGFGLIFIEAGACGKPVVGYDCTAISERIKNGFNGFKVKSFEEFVKKCELLAKDKKLRKILGENGRRIAQKYIWEKVVKEYEKTFKMAVS